MAKIILNECFGGYNYSPEALADIYRMKGETVTVKPGRMHDEVYIYDFRVYGSVIERDDPEAIKLLEEKGSEYCSGVYSKLVIQEYDEKDYIANIDEYDGVESLHLIPRITEARIRECGNIDEVVALLSRLKVFVNEEAYNNNYEEEDFENVNC